MSRVADFKDSNDKDALLQKIDRMRKLNGDTCIGEMVRYKWKFAGKNKKDVVCTDKPNTCERSLCECDLKFSQEVIKLAKIARG